MHFALEPSPVASLPCAPSDALPSFAASDTAASGPASPPTVPPHLRNANAEMKENSLMRASVLRERVEALEDATKCLYRPGMSLVEPRAGVGDDDAIEDCCDADCDGLWCSVLVRAECAADRFEQITERTFCRGVEDAV